MTNRESHNYWNQATTLKKVNEKVKVSKASFWKYERAGFFGPDSFLLHGKRKMPGYSDERIAEIIDIIIEFKLKGSRLNEDSVRVRDFKSSVLSKNG